MEEINKMNEQIQVMNYMMHQLVHINHAAMVLIDAYIENGKGNDEAAMIIKDILKMSDINNFS